MAKHYHTGEYSDPGELLKVLHTFLSSCRSPALLEYGDELMPLSAGEYALEIRSGRLWIDAWPNNRSLSRRILAIGDRAAGTLVCVVHRFGGAPGKLSFLDLARPQTAHRTLSGSRESFAGRFRQMLGRQFPGWQIDVLSSGMDLQRSLSPVYPRARLTRGSRQIVAMACPDAQSEPALLTFALIWFHLAMRRPGSHQLCLFVPDTCGELTAHRLRWLDRETLRPRLFRFNEHGSAGEVDPQDLGNIETRVSPQYTPIDLPAAIASLLAELVQIEGVGVSPEITGELSLRSRGMQFARVRNGRVFLGLNELREVTLPDLAEVLHFARQMSSLPSLPTAEERWLECAVRLELQRIDPILHPTLLHGQVLTFAGADRDLIDLLGVSPSGRLMLLELKTTEDIHLPVQALDYWIRVRWHAERGQLNHLFPGIPLTSAPPRLFLVAPALSFHPAVESVLRYFLPSIDVERIGVNSNWQQGLKVVLRLARASSPQSHQTSYEHYDRPTQYQESNFEPEP